MICKTLPERPFKARSSDVSFATIPFNIRLSSLGLLELLGIFTVYLTLLLLLASVTRSIIALQSQVFSFALSGLLCLIPWEFHSAIGSIFFETREKSKRELVPIHRISWDEK